MLVFDRAEAEYQAARYASCSALLTGLFRRATGHGFTTDTYRDEARHYAFACAHLSGDAELAKEHVKAGLRENPGLLDPDPQLFRPNVIERFRQIRVSAEEELIREGRDALKDQAEEKKRFEKLKRERAEQLEELKAMAREERVFQKNNRWMAAVPFGVGQFQNRSDALGWFFLTSEVLLVGTLATATIIELDTHSQNPTGPVVAEANSNLSAARSAQVIGGWGFLALAVIGIVEAQVNFVPEFEGAPDVRELPDHLENLEASERPGIDWRPTLRAGEDGAAVGVVVSF